jgi:hypothetical protein
MGLAPALASERVKVYRAVLVEDNPATVDEDEALDELGNPVQVEQAELPEEAQEEAMASVRPVAATEEELNRATRITKYQVYLPAHVQLNALVREVQG